MKYPWYKKKKMNTKVQKFFFTPTAKFASACAGANGAAAAFSLAALRALNCLAARGCVAARKFVPRSYDWAARIFPWSLYRWAALSYRSIKFTATGSLTLAKNLVVVFAVPHAPDTYSYWKINSKSFFARILRSNFFPQEKKRQRKSAIHKFLIFFSLNKSFWHIFFKTTISTF